MKDHLLTLMEAIVQQKKSFLSTIPRQRQNFARVYIAMVIIVIYLLTEKKSINLKQIIGPSTFQFNFVVEKYLMDSVLLSLEKYLEKKIFTIFQ